MTYKQHRKFRLCALQYRYRLHWHCIHVCCVAVGWCGSSCSAEVCTLWGCSTDCHPVLHNISEEQRPKWHDCSRCSCIHGSWWCCSHTPIWTCAMAMLIAVGEHIKCCPLLTDRSVQKRGDNCLRKSWGAVCGNTLYPTTRTISPSW